jgi:hypothetical protein
MPGVDDRPAKQWPPLRGATGRPARAAKASASATSSAAAQRTIAAGRAPAKFRIAGRRNASYAGSSGSTTSPVIARRSAAQSCRAGVIPPADA